MRLFRLHMKTSAKCREELINYCLKNSVLPIGWSYLHNEFDNLDSGKDLSDAYVRKHGKTKKSLKWFAELQIDDLIWTRDLNGIYYLCRVKALPKAEYIPDMDIGAVVSVDIVKVGICVPGLIVARFHQSNGHNPAIQPINDEMIGIYSKDYYNQLSGQSVYEIETHSYDLFTMLPPLDLEELVIDYLQIKYDYYLSKNSVAKLDTTIKVECELYPKNSNFKPAVVQVKHNSGDYCQKCYSDYVKEGKKVFLFFADEKYGDDVDEVICIKKNELVQFAFDHLDILPVSIKNWIQLCKKN